MLLMFRYGDIITTVRKLVNTFLQIFYRGHKEVEILRV